MVSKIINKYIDYFGFLSNSYSFKIDDGEICPCDDYEKNYSEVEDLKNRDEFIYPCEVVTKRISLGQKKSIKIIPKTKRPAMFYTLPNSHCIKLNTNSTIEDLRYNDSAFLMYFLGFLFNTRLQFKDWYIEGRVPITSHNYFGVDQKEAEECLNYGYKFWNNLNIENKKLFINILFMHMKSRSYEWDYERFTFEYMVFDGLFKIIFGINSQVMTKIKHHKDRIKWICDFYSIEYKIETLEKIAKLRNDLFHESLWGEGMPGRDYEFFASHSPDHLHKLNQRIITCLVGYNNKFSRSNWEGVITRTFDPFVDVK